MPQASIFSGVTVVHPNPVEIHYDECKSPGDGVMPVNGCVLMPEGHGLMEGKQYTLKVVGSACSLSVLVVKTVGSKAYFVGIR